MVCCAPLTFSALSVSLRLPGSGLPAESGEKLRARLQLAPSVRLDVAEQFVPPVAAVQLAGTVSPLTVSVALPLLATVTVCGLSLLVWPTTVLAKLRLGGVASGSSSAALL